MSRRQRHKGSALVKKVIFGSLALLAAVALAFTGKTVLKSFSTVEAGTTSETSTKSSAKAKSAVKVDLVSVKRDTAPSSSSEEVETSSSTSTEESSEEVTPSQASLPEVSAEQAPASDVVASEVAAPAPAVNSADYVTTTNYYYAPEQQANYATSYTPAYNGGYTLANGNTAGAIGSEAAAQMAAATGVSQATWEYIIARESNGDPNAYNASGASGLFQTIPGWGSTATVQDQINSAINAYNAQGLAAWGMQ